MLPKEERLGIHSYSPLPPFPLRFLRRLPARATNFFLSVELLLAAVRRPRRGRRVEGW